MPRRSVSISGALYEALQKHAHGKGASVSGFLEEHLRQLFDMPALATVKPPAEPSTRPPKKTGKAPGVSWSPQSHAAVGLAAREARRRARSAGPPIIPTGTNATASPRSGMPEPRKVPPPQPGRSPRNQVSL